MEIWKNNNLLKKYRESLPLEDRDDYADWKKDYDYKNTSEYKRDKFRNQLNTKLNKEGIKEVWLEFGENVAGDYWADLMDLSEFDDFNENQEELFEIPLGRDDYFDSINQIIWFSTGKNSRYSYKHFTDIIDNMMKSKKVTIGLSFKFRSSLFEESNNRSLKNFINLYSKEFIEFEFPRKFVGNTKNFLVNFDKIMAPYVDKLERDLNIISMDIDNPYIDQDKVLNCGIHFEIPYNFGVKNNDTEGMREEAEKLRKHILKIVNFVFPYLLCQEDS